MAEQFFDTPERSAHDGFQNWRAANQDGTFLAIAVTKALLHGARCQHLGGGPPYYSLAEHPHSLTAKKKVCGAEEDLLRWAEDNGIAVVNCRHCKRDGYIR